MNKHDEIIKDILSKGQLVESLENYLNDCLIYMHTGLGIFIRNKYLWKSKTNTKYFMNFYGKDNVDDISECIIRDIVSEVVKRK